MNYKNRVGGYTVSEMQSPLSFSGEDFFFFFLVIVEMLHNCPKYVKSAKKTKCESWSKSQVFFNRLENKTVHLLGFCKCIE